jgi:hypothetical protein
MTGTYFRITRDEIPEVAETKSIFVARPDTLQGMLAEQEEIEELSRKLSKPELEVVTRILGKMARGLRLARTILNFDESFVEVETGRPTASRASFIKLDLEKELSKLVAPNPVIMSALQDYNLPELNKLFPANHPPPSSDMKTDQPTDTRPEHISEWSELTSSIKSRFRRETDTDLRESTLALKHQVNGDSYYMRFRMRGGQLLKIQLLCWDLDNNWLTQEFDLAGDQLDDDLDRLKIKTQWDRAALIEAVTNGRPITNEEYTHYLQVAASDPKSDLSVGKVTNLPVHKKRPAA